MSQIIILNIQWLFLSLFYYYKTIFFDNFLYKNILSNNIELYIINKQKKYGLFQRKYKNT